MACSTLYFEKPPEPDSGMQYRGIQFVLDCDRDDYPHFGVTVAFSDQSTLSCDLTLEQGQHEYLVDRGFRREKHPPRWDLLRYVMLTLDAGRHTTDVTYRLQRMTMLLFRYERRPEFNGSEKIYSLDDLRRFGEFCRDHFIDVCPAWQIGGHANWWLTIGYHPELREKGWPSQGDVTHPDHDPIVYDCMLDVIEALQPKYVSPKSDEWWHERRPDETPDELLHGKTRAQAFLDFHTKLNAWLHERGVTMMIYEDMLSPYHNGKRFETYRVIDAFPKDVILTLWSGGNTDKEIRYFTERGFRVWPNATGMFTLSDESKGHVMGFGKGIYSFGNDKARLLDEYSPLWSLSNILRTADYAWNFAKEESVDPARLRGCFSS